MNKILFIAIAFIFFACHNNANASTIVRPNGQIDTEYQALDDRANVEFGEHLRITVYRESCPHYRPRIVACAVLQDRRIYMPQFVPYYYFHEKAHIWDYESDDVAARIVRGGFMTHMSYPIVDNTAWWKTEETVGWPISYMAEKFADALSYCAWAPKKIWGNILEKFQGYGWHPNKIQARRICNMFTKNIK